MFNDDDRINVLCVKESNFVFFFVCERTVEEVMIKMLLSQYVGGE